MVKTTYRLITEAINGTSSPSEPAKSGKATSEGKTSEPKPVPFKVIKQTPIVREAVNKAETVVKDVTDKVREEYTDLVERAEAAIAGKPYPPVQEVSLKSEGAETASTEQVLVSETKLKVYDAPLPLECEPPPGFSRPPPKSKFGSEPGQPESKPEHPELKPIVLPLVAPALALASEPIITHLAGAIDNLATYLNSDPKAAEQASDVLELAKSDLTALVERIEVVKEQERTALEAKMDEQTREYTLKLMELEMEGQDKLENQEHEFRIFFEQERARFIQAYREKLDHELRVQTELINERCVIVCYTSCLRRLKHLLQAKRRGDCSGY